MHHNILSSTPQIMSQLTIIYSDYSFFRLGLLWVEMFFVCLVTRFFFFKFRKLRVIQYGLVCIKCICLKNKTIFKSSLAKNGKYVCHTCFTAASHTFLLFSFFTHKLQLVGYNKLGVL